MDTELLSDLGRVSTKDQVTARLRDAITTGVLTPGQRLQQEELAERLGVSRMPVREALRQLEAEGLVTFQPYRGAIVAKLSADELIEIYEIRIALETLALRGALPSFDAARLRNLEATLALMEGTDDSERWLALNRTFHDQLYMHPTRRLLLEHIAALRNKSEPFLRLFAAAPDRTHHAQAEHRAILSACRAGDVDTACRLLGEHLQTTVLSLSSALRERDAGGDPAPPPLAPPTED